MAPLKLHSHVLNALLENSNCKFTPSSHIVPSHKDRRTSSPSRKNSPSPRKPKKSFTAPTDFSSPVKLSATSVAAKLLGLEKSGSQWTSDFAKSLGVRMELAKFELFFDEAKQDDYTLQSKSALTSTVDLAPPDSAVTQLPLLKSALKNDRTAIGLSLHQAFQYYLHLSIHTEYVDPSLLDHHLNAKTKELTERKGDKQRIRHEVFFVDPMASNLLEMTGFMSGDPRAYATGMGSQYRNKLTFDVSIINDKGLTRQGIITNIPDWLIWHLHHDTNVQEVVGLGGECAFVPGAWDMKLGQMFSQAVGAAYRNFNTAKLEKNDVTFHMFRMQGWYVDFVKVHIPLAWFEEWEKGLVPTENSVSMMVYPEKPLYLGSKADRDNVIRWFNSFRVYACRGSLL